MEDDPKEIAKTIPQEFFNVLDAVFDPDRDWESIKLIDEIRSESGTKTRKETIRILKILRTNKLVNLVTCHSLDNPELRCGSGYVITGLGHRVKKLF